MGVFKNLLGTINTTFQFGLGGVKGKTVNNKLRVRNAGDTVDAPLVASSIAASGNDIILNESAQGTLADWLFTLRRPSTGQSEARTIILPAGNPAVGQALQVAAYNSVSGIVTLDYLTIAAGTDKEVVDTTTIGFNSTSPVGMFSLPANAIVRLVTVIIDTAFNGAPSLSIGIAGTTAKYLGSTDADLTQPAGTSFEVVPNLNSVNAVESLIATYTAGGATAGSARILVQYVIPS